MNKEAFSKEFPTMNRRTFIKTTGLSLAATLISDSLFSSINQPPGQLINLPDEVSGIIDGHLVRLAGNGYDLWTYNNVSVRLENTGTEIAVLIYAPSVRLSSITLGWKLPNESSSQVLNDHWERTYGDVSWHEPTNVEILPWYFLEFNGHSTNGFGVRTGASAFCSWQLGKGKLELTLDTRSGGNGVLLSDRQLRAAEIVTVTSDSDESPFQTVRRFAKRMCGGPRLPKEPLYGINDWYFSYGNNSEQLIMEHTKMMAPLADGLANRPFSVIDAGWFLNHPSMPDDCCWGDTMGMANHKFGDMGLLAERIKNTGMRPGLWTRPLCASYKDPASLLIPVIKGREANKPVLDPTIPENLERVQSYFRLYNQWGYELIKFDFTSFDIFGKWGFEMLKEKSITAADWSMNNSGKTNAEIILNLYRAIREAAGATYIIGCNTFGHLSAGIFELNRIGDDTSGNEWARTRTMGVNTLAFRGIQHNIFYAADPDCVGITPKVPWVKNSQWMRLVAKSGVPLFISAQPEATGPIQKKEIKEAFDLASRNLPLGEPLDWMETPFPKKWKLNGEVEIFDWS